MIKRRKTREVKIGDLIIGGEHAITVQSMTTTKTDDITGTLKEVERLEEESSSIKCAATNFKNKLTLFFLKDMNQLKTNLHSINPNPIDTSINNQQENLHSKTNSQSIIPKTIGTRLIQNRCTQHQPNQSTRHQISFRLDALIRNFHSSKHDS